MRVAYPQLFASLAAGDVVVTSTALLASVATQQFASARMQEAELSWEAVPIQSIDVWLASCWQEVRYTSGDAPVLLSRLQEILLWRQLIEADAPQLFDSEATAQLARRAALIVDEWGIRLDAAEWNDNSDALHFRNWYRAFKRLCSERGFITRGDLWGQCSSSVANGSLDVGGVSFLGFRSPSPVFQQLLGALGERATMAEDKPGLAAVAAEMIVCGDIQEEVEHAARWARGVFERSAGESIGVFIPDLLSRRGLIERTFEQIFYPASAMRFGPQRDAASTIFHIASPASLDRHPAVASALLLLELRKPRVKVADAGAILRCPFIAGALIERNERAQADVALRRRRELEVSLAQMQWASRNCSRLAPVWETLLSLQHECPPRQDLPSWCEFFGKLLNAVGWPGDSELTSGEAKAVEGWNSALNTLGMLAMVSGPVSYGTAIEYLRRVLDTCGTESGDWSSPVQILDVCAAAGLECDHALAVGVSDETWPAVQYAPALIPLKLQVAYGVPCASPQGIQEEQARVATALFSVAPELTASYSGRLSPFAAPYAGPSAATSPRWEGRSTREWFGGVTLEEFSDGTAPAYQGGGEARGGTGILKSQSLCPFRAFAEYRLEAEGPDDACLGFDPLQRGGFLHKALELAWGRLRTQDQLLSLSDDELQMLAHEVAVEAVEAQGGEPFHRQTAQVERERLRELLLDWLHNVEKTRTQPFAVEMLEQERYFELGGLGLRLRVDRIDRLDNGKLLLIDYKSGETSRSSLDDERPGEPQLLIYAAALGREVDGLFFGQLKPRCLKLIGYSREQHVPGRAMGVLREKWDGFLDSTYENLQRIAQEFVEGHMAVRPAKGACVYCKIKPLCRVRESQALTGDFDTEG